MGVQICFFDVLRSVYRKMRVHSVIFPTLLMYLKEKERNSLES